MKNINFVIAHPELLVAQALEQLVREQKPSASVHLFTDIPLVRKYLFEHHPLPILNRVNCQADWLLIVDLGSLLSIKSPATAGQFGLGLYYLPPQSLDAGLLTFHHAAVWLGDLPYSHESNHFIATIDQYLLGQMLPDKTPPRLVAES